MRAPKTTFDSKKLEDLGSTIIAYELAIVSILEVLAKTQPSIARAIAQEMEEHRDRVSETNFPKVREKVSLYISMIERTLAQSPH